MRVEVAFMFRGKGTQDTKGCSEAVEEVLDVHGWLALGLDAGQARTLRRRIGHAVGLGAVDGAGSAAPVAGQGGAVNSKGAALGKGGPSPREGVEPSDLVVDLLRVAAPVDEAVFLEQFGSFVQALAFCGEFGLRDGLRRAVSQVVHSGHQQVFAGVEQPVVNNAGGVVGSDGHFDACRARGRCRFRA